jgi:nucleotide-binding universal stress UspA family protein
MTKLKILIPVDGTEFSEAIFPRLVLLAEPAKTEIMLLRVSELVAQPSQVTSDLVKGSFSPAMAESNVRHAVRGEMVAEAEMLEEIEYTVQREVGFGDPAEQILFYADLAQADLIAMTTHGREGLSRLLAGSVAESVLHKAKVPVLMVRPDFSL